MDLEFYIDPETGMPHIYRHGVEEYEVEDVLDSRPEDWSSRRAAREANGQTRGGRYLTVVYRRDDETGRIFVMTAYDLRGSSLEAHRRRQRRKRPR